LATKDQFEFFRALYDEEERRYEQLEGRAKLYLSIITALLAAFVLKADEVKRSGEKLLVPWPLMLVEALLLAAALLLVILGSLIRTYEGVADPEQIIDPYGQKPPSDAVFFDLRIADFAVATNRNSNVNDRTARYLSAAGVLLALAMLTLLVLFAVALRH